MAKFERNSKALNMLFAAIGTAEYQHVYHLETAREVWTKLASRHEGTATVKARLF